jgi:hypothetical protein
METIFHCDDVLHNHFLVYLVPRDFIRLSEVAKGLRLKVLSDKLWMSEKYLPLANTTFGGVPAYLVYARRQSVGILRKKCFLLTLKNASTRNPVTSIVLLKGVMSIDILSVTDGKSGLHFFTRPLLTCCLLLSGNCLAQAAGSVFLWNLKGGLLSSMATGSADVAEKIGHTRQFNHMKSALKDPQR